MRIDRRSAWRVCAVMTLASSAALPAASKQFANSYVSFQIPEDWTCKLDETEWVCSPPPLADGKYAMIAILTAKCVGLEDSPQLYKEHLIAVSKTEGVEVAQAPQDTLIDDVLWVDASLRNSEVKGYTTRYLARTEGNIGVVVTFSAHRTAEQEAKPISDLIASSVLINSQKAFSNNKSYESTPDKCPQSR